MTRRTEPDEPAEIDARTLHDTCAAPLYRYAWSLMGGDAGQAAAATRDALVAGAELDGERAEHTERLPWLYALTRTACQQRGLANTCPYTDMATVAEEEPVARMFAHLPAGHRELIELDLRHGLSPADVSRILGLATTMCVELTRSAVRRADDNLLGFRDGSGPDEDVGEQAPAALRRRRVRRVAAALELLRPPGPAPGLRADVLETATGADRAARERIVAAMRPLDEHGYPVHRVRASAGRHRPAGPAADPPQEEQGPNAGTGVPQPLPEDRLTTDDHPVRTEHTTSPASPDAPPEPAEHTRTCRVLPVVSGLATVAVAVGLWLWAGALGGPATVVGPEAAGPAEAPPSAEAPTASDEAPGPVPQEGAGNGGEPVPDGTSAPDGNAGGAEQTQPPGPPQGQDGGEEGPDSPSAPETPPPEEEPPGTEPAPPPPQEPEVPEPPEGPPTPPETPEEEIPEDDRDRRGLVEDLLDLILGSG